MAANSDTFEEWTSRPFSPSHVQGNGHATEVSERVACALEYIAAQLGEISRKLDHVGSGFQPSSDDLAHMNELLKKL